MTSGSHTGPTQGTGMTQAKAPLDSRAATR